MGKKENLSFSKEVAETLGLECAIILDLFNKNKFSGELAFGAAIRTGNDEIKSGELGYGCKVNFRELIAFGYDISDTKKIQLSAQHMSNGSLCDPNQGLTSVGLRFAWKIN